MKNGNATQIIEAMLWGVFFSIAPFYEVIILGVVIWLPLLIWLEQRRAKKHGFFPFGIYRIILASVIVISASQAPLKYLDRSIEPADLKNNTVTLRNLEGLYRNQMVYFRFPKEYSRTVIQLPKSPVPLKTLIISIEHQTGLIHSIRYCGNGASFLWGSSPIGSIHFSAKKT